MDKYYKVRTFVYDNGKVKCVYEGEFEFWEKPQDEFTEKANYDEYIDWFYSYNEAMNFIEDTKLA